MAIEPDENSFAMVANDYEQHVNHVTALFDAFDLVIKDAGVYSLTSPGRSALTMDIEFLGVPYTFRHVYTHTGVRGGTSTIVVSRTDPSTGVREAPKPLFSMDIHGDAVVLGGANVGKAKNAAHRLPFSSLSAAGNL